MSIWNILEDLNHVDKLIRNAAYVRLLDEAPDAMPDLLDAYHGVDGMAQLMLIRAFGELGDDRAVPVLLDAMADREPDSTFMLPSFAAKSLGQIGGERALEGIKQQLDESDQTVRRMAVVVLKHMGDDASIDLLRDALHDDDQRVRRQAVKALKDINTPRALAILYKAGQMQP